jgi:signal transduction histidine kinase/predicted transcriptional regulator
MFLKDFIHPIDDTVDVLATLQEVVDKMSTERLHHIIIIDQNKPVGIISEQDIVRFFSSRMNFQECAIDYAVRDLVVLHHTRLVEYALTMMLNNNIRKIIVIDNNDNYIACMEQEDLIYTLEEKIQGKSLKLQQLTHSGNKAVLIREDSTLKQALDIMTTNKLTSVLIASDEKAIGIISESDIIKLAQQNVNQEEIVKYFMHAPIIQIEEYKTAEDMIQLMQKQRIRRVVVFNSNDEHYYTLSSKDVAAIVRGNYTKFLESKFYDSRDTFNALSEYIIELIDVEGEQIIFWTNGITKANFDIRIDDCITKLIDKNQWKKLYETLKVSQILYDTVEIQNRYYQIKGHYGTMIDDNVIKLFLNDITEIMTLTEQLKKENDFKEKLLFDQAKMVQMGEMIGNIAHQWRQPLSMITVTASGMGIQQEMGTLQVDSIPDKMKVIVDNANYLSDTIDIFRNFLKEKKELRELVVQESIQKAFMLTNATLQHNHIKLIDNIKQTKPIVIQMIMGELEQVIINIINNAKDILIEKEILDPWIKVELRLDDSSNVIIISIEDNGGGIPNDVLPHIFSEYFTTKEHSNGTGLGLHMSQQIITNSFKGKLYAKNTQNGAKFSVELPLESPSN